MQHKNTVNPNRFSDKFFFLGARSFSDVELLAIILKSDLRRKSCEQLAQKMLDHYQTLHQICAEPFENLHAKFKINIKTYTFLHASLELGKRYLNEEIKPAFTLNTTQAAAKFMQNFLRDYKIEIFAVLYLGTELNYLGFEELFRGTVNEATIYPREILKHCLLHHANKIIIAHNHPSGQLAPSRADRDITKVIRKSLALLDVHLLDHLIVAKTGYFSFKKAGLL